MLCALHKDRTLIVLLEQKQEGTLIVVANAHLAAGPQADRRMRQAHEALDAMAKELKRRGFDPSKVPTIFCGDFNSQGRNAVRHLLTTCEIGPDFSEENGKQVTTKIKRHNFAPFEDASETVFGFDAVPATILATNIDSKMIRDDGTPTPLILDALRDAFGICSAGRDVMHRSDVERWLTNVNRQVGRGSEFRAAMAAFEKRGEETLDLQAFTDIYVEELREGKFWGVEHDLRALGGSGLAIPSEGPCELCYDHIFYTPSSLHLVGVQDALTDDQRQLIWNDPWDVLPNAWHPSDHLPVSAIFKLPN